MAPHLKIQSETSKIQQNRSGVGPEDSNAVPLPHTPIPATLRGEQNAEKVSL